MMAKGERLEVDDEDPDETGPISADIPDAESAVAVAVETGPAEGEEDEEEWDDLEVAKSVF